MYFSYFFGRSGKGDWGLVFSLLPDPFPSLLKVSTTNKLDFQLLTNQTTTRYFNWRWMRSLKGLCLDAKRALPAAAHSCSC